jgi:hypothetical protein
LEKAEFILDINLLFFKFIGIKLLVKLMKIRLKFRLDLLLIMIYLEEFFFEGGDEGLVSLTLGLESGERGLVVFLVSMEEDLELFDFVFGRG